MFIESYYKQANTILESLKNKGLKLATAESCTGGLFAALLTEIVGSSAVFECGFVTYSNQSKINLLEVDAALIEKHGAVSEEVVCAMAQGAIKKSNADIAIAITGIAGPGGGSAKKPVGLVYIAIASKTTTTSKKYTFTGNRQDIRLNSVAHTLLMLDSIITNF